MNRWLLVVCCACALAVPSAGLARPVSLMSGDELIRTLLFDGVKDRREDAAEALGDKYVVDGLPALVDAAFHDRSSEVRETAVWALEDLGGPEAIGALQRLLTSSTAPVDSRVRALQVLQEVDPERIPPEVTVELAEDPIARKMLGRQAVSAVVASDGDSSYRVYLSLLDAPGPLARRKGARLLADGRWPSAEVAPALERVAAGDPVGDVRAQALDALRFHAHAGLLPLLHDALIDEGHFKAWALAAILLQPLADERSAEVIADVLRDDIDQLVEATALRLMRTLVRVGDAGDAAILDAVAAGDRSPSVVQEATRGAELLRGGDEAARLRWGTGLAPMLAVRVVDPGHGGVVAAPGEADARCVGELALDGFVLADVAVLVDGARHASSRGHDGDTRLLRLHAGVHSVRVIHEAQGHVLSSGEFTIECGERRSGHVNSRDGLAIEPVGEPEIDGGPASASDAEPEAAPEPEPEAAPAPEPEAAPAPESEAAPAPEPEAAPEIEPEAAPESEAAPEPESEAAPEPESGAVSDPEPESSAEPQP